MYNTILRPINVNHNYQSSKGFTFGNNHMNNNIFHALSVNEDHQNDNEYMHVPEVLPKTGY